MYDKLVIKVSAIDTKIPSTFVLVTKTQYRSSKQGLKKKVKDVDKKVHNTNWLVKESDCSTKITETKSNVLSITELVISAALL